MQILKETNTHAHFISAPLSSYEYHDDHIMSMHLGARAQPLGDAVKHLLLAQRGEALQLVEDLGEVGRVVQQRHERLAAVGHRHLVLLPGSPDRPRSTPERARPAAAVHRPGPCHAPVQAAAPLGAAMGQEGPRVLVHAVAGRAVGEDARVVPGPSSKKDHFGS